MTHYRTLENSNEKGIKKMKIGWLSIIFVFSFALSAQADIVTGRVYDKTGTFQPGDVIIINNDPVQTNKKDGSYRVFLPPGTYDVSLERDNTLKGKVQSFPQPSHQDIYLLKELR